MISHPPTRRSFLQVSAGLAATAIVPGAFARSQPGDTQWHDVTEWGVEGRGWTGDERLRYFDRLPARAEDMVREAVWNLSRDSAGMAVRFRTDAREIHVDYRLLRDRLAMPHMPATGVSGVDLYGKLDNGELRWVNVVRPNQVHITTTLVRGLDGASREYRLYLPLYNGVETLRIGVPAGTQFERLAPRDERPLVFYGTSIMHGACASRPGMAIPALLGRRYDLPTINLGFSGNGRMEEAVGRLLTEIDARVFCIDCLPNMNAETVRQRAVPLVRQLRAAHPQTPILLVEDRSFTNAPFLPERRSFHAANRAALREAYEALTEAGVKHLHYLAGEGLLGDDGEGATDGSHPNDLGFLRYAESYATVLDDLVADSESG